MPIAYEASMNGSERIRSASLRSRRAYQGTETSATPIAAVFKPDAEPDGDGHREDQRREREDRVHRAHRDAVADAADRPGEQADQPADQRAGERHERRDDQRDARAVGDAREARRARAGRCPSGATPTGFRASGSGSARPGPCVQRIGAKIANSTSSSEHDHRDGQFAIGEHRARQAHHASRRPTRAWARAAPAAAAPACPRHRVRAARSSSAQPLLPFDLHFSRSVYYRRQRRARRRRPSGQREAVVVRQAAHDFIPR